MNNPRNLTKSQIKFVNLLRLMRYVFLNTTDPRWRIVNKLVKEGLVSHEGPRVVLTKDGQLIAKLLQEKP